MGLTPDLGEGAQKMTTTEGVPSGEESDQKEEKGNKPSKSKEQVCKQRRIKIVSTRAVWTYVYVSMFLKTFCELFPIFWDYLKKDDPGFGVPWNPVNLE